MKNRGEIRKKREDSMKEYIELGRGRFGYESGEDRKKLEEFQ